MKRWNYTPRIETFTAKQRSSLALCSSCAWIEMKTSCLNSLIYHSYKGTQMRCQEIPKSMEIQTLFLYERVTCLQCSEQRLPPIEDPRGSLHKRGSPTTSLSSPAKANCSLQPPYHRQSECAAADHRSLGLTTK